MPAHTSVECTVQARAEAAHLPVLSEQACQRACVEDGTLARICVQDCVELVLGGLPRGGLANSGAYIPLVWVVYLSARSHYGWA